MSVSVVALTLNFRQPAMTAECVRSLIADGAHRVVVVDNSADDGVSARALTMALSDLDAASVHESPRNLGFAAGVNLGVQLFRCTNPSSPILLINNDAVIVQGSLQRLVRKLEENPDALAVVPSVVERGTFTSGCGYYCRPLGLVTRRKWPGCFPFPSGCCMLIATDRIDGPVYDEDFFMYGEDVELGWRWSADGLILNESEARVLHRGAASSVRGSLFYETHVVTGHLLLAKKLAREPGEIAFFLACRALALPLRALVRSVRTLSFEPAVGLIKGARCARDKLSRL